MNELAGVLLDLFLIYLLARLAGEGFDRLGLPVVVGELLVGVALGRHALGVIGVPGGSMIDLFGSRHTAQIGLDFVYSVIGQLGLIVLLFYIGLETQFERLLSALPRATMVAVPGFLLTMGLGTSFMLALQYAPREAFFVGAAMVATSVAISARVMKSLGVLATAEGEIILAAAVLDDILGLLVLAAVTVFAKSGGVDIRAVVLVGVEAVAFVLFALLVARRFVGRYSFHLERLRLESGPLAFALVLMLGMSALAAEAGLAGVVGAFLAGIVLSESRDRLRLSEQVRPIYDFLTPFFFVFTGAQVDLGVFSEPRLVWIAVGITAIAIVAKVVGCGVGGWGRGMRSMAFLGVAMVPRGEIGFAVASIGFSLGVISSGLFSVVIFMSIATAVVAPFVLQLLHSSAPGSKGSSSVIRT